MESNNQRNYLRGNSCNLAKLNEDSKRMVSHKEQSETKQRTAADAYKKCGSTEISPFANELVFVVLIK